MGVEYKLDVGGDLFYGINAEMPYSEWKKAEGMLELSYEDCLAAFEAYAEENGPQCYYLEEEFDDDGEENDDYDPYLWVRSAGEAPDEHWYEISLEEAVDWVCERFESVDVDFSYEIEQGKFEQAVAGADPDWQRVHGAASEKVKRLLEFIFLKRSDPALVERFKDEYQDRLRDLEDGFKVQDWEALVECMRGRQDVPRQDVETYEKKLFEARERVALKGYSATGLFKKMKQAVKDWENKQLSNDECWKICRECEELFMRLDAIGRVSEAMYNKFENFHDTALYLVVDDFPV